MSPKPRPDLWFRRLRNTSAVRTRLLIFPCAGASATSYHDWSADLPPDMEAHALQLPGRGDRFREDPVTDLEALISQITTASLGLMDLPFVFLGHSLGALLSFETARELRRRGDSLPVHLFAAGRAAPQIPETGPSLHRLADKELIEELRMLGGMPEEILAEPDLIELVLPALRADLFIHETFVYREEAPLPCPITALGGTSDDDVPVEELRAWGAQTSSEFRYRMFEGGHFFVHAERKNILRIMSESLARRSRFRA
jgi:surfactin synthase thioesterase subunit